MSNEIRVALSNAQLALLSSDNTKSSFDILTCQEIKEKNPTYDKILKKFRKEKYRVYF